jgi:hypothetical protein
VAVGRSAEEAGGCSVAYTVDLTMDSHVDVLALAAAESTPRLRCAHELQHGLTARTLDPDAIGGGTARDRVESWDSLKHIMLPALENEFAVSFEGHKIETLMSCDDVVLQLKR